MVSDHVEDLARFKQLRSQIFKIIEISGKQADQLGITGADRTVIMKLENRRQILSLWFGIVDNFMALDTLSQKHGDFFKNLQDKNRNQSFHLYRAIFLTQYRTALDFLQIMEQNPDVETILNESDPSLGLPENLYNYFKYHYLNIIKAGHYAAIEAIAKTYNTPHSNSELNKWTISDSKVILSAGKGPGPIMTFENGINIIRKFGQKLWFPVQKGTAEWMGRTKVLRHNRSLISQEQIDSMSQILEPGDILLERREWYMTNMGIPGFWTHAALFIGNKTQRDAYSKHPEVKTWLKNQGANSLDDLISSRYPGAWKKLQLPYKDGKFPAVIESISTGVTLTSLKYSAGCDSLAVLRPQIPKPDRAAAVVRAISYQGRPYDYNFDFISDQSLVCTELIVKSFLPGPSKKGLKFPSKNLMGRLITPANAFVEQFDQTFGSQNQQTDLILFLDGNEKTMAAVESDIDTFRRSWKRPKWHILTEYVTRKETY